MPYFRGGKDKSGKTIIKKRLPGGGTKVVGHTNNPDAYLKKLHMVSHGK